EFQLTGLGAGAWTIRVEMRGFVTETRDLTLPLAAPLAAPLAVALTMRAYEEIVPVSKPPEPSRQPVSDPDDTSIIAGSLATGAATPDALPRAFGNNRPRGVPLYKFVAGALFGNSAWNARPYSFTAGTSAAPPSYGDRQLELAMS